jgi:very-short-patch-repair endonuclease
VIRDIADGAQALGELDFAALCRERGLPEPTRQVTRKLANARVYLDVYWDDCGLVVEIDGSGHREGLQATNDYLRDNEVALGGDTTIRINLMGLRLEADRFMGKVVRARAQLLARRAVA